MWVVEGDGMARSYTKVGHMLVEEGTQKWAVEADV
jgi:hypothetical protein